MTEKKIILDLCGGTGAWSRPYVEAEYDVRNITLPDYDVRNYKSPKNVYGILAAPPCTEFSLAKGNQSRDFDGAMEIVKACLNIIWQCHPIFWCLENPRGFLRQFLGKPPLTVHYWEFGGGKDKPTDLWGYYNFPRRRYKEPPMLIQKIEETPGGKIDCPSRIKRARTPSGFARAFFDVNR